VSPCNLRTTTKPTEPTTSTLLYASLLYNADDAAEGARLINDSYAALVRQHPNRFAAYAVLPLPHVKESLRELQRALDDLGLCGVVIACSVQRTRSPVEPEFEPLYEEMNRRGCPLYFHSSGNGIFSPFLNDYGLTYAEGAPVRGDVLDAAVAALRTPSSWPPYCPLGSA